MPSLPAESSPQKDLEDLLKRAMEQPGVADVMRVYSEYERVVTMTNEYLRAANVSQPLVATRSSSD